MKSNRTNVSLGALLLLLVPLLVSAQMVWTCVTNSAQWSPRFGQQLVIFHDTMWLFSGFNTGQPLNDVWYSTDGDSWICATPSAQWSPRSSPRAFVFDDKIWLTGGFHWVGYWTGLDDVWWSSDGINWILATDSAGWAPRGIHTAVVFHDTMWVIGGLNNTSSGPFYNDVWKSADGVSWVCVMDSMPWAVRGGHTTVILHDSLWLICGYGCSDIWCSGDGHIWSCALDSVPWGPRYGHNSVVLRDTIWSMAGYFHNDVWYSADGTNWLMAVNSAEWSPRHLPASAAYANTMWLTGGTNDYWSGLNDVWNSTGLGIEEGGNVETHATVRFPTIFHGPLQLPEGNKCKVFDITGRVVEPRAIARGIYFLEVNNKIVQKVVKVR